MSRLSHRNMISPQKKKYNSEVRYDSFQHHQEPLNNLHLIEFQKGLRKLATDSPLRLESKRLILFDFDGTIADAERLHAASYAAAIQMYSGLDISDKQTGIHGISKEFSGLFGPYEMQSCYEAVLVLKAHHPEHYYNLRQSLAQAPKSKVVAKDDARHQDIIPNLHCARLLRDGRAMAVEHYRDNARVGSTKPDGTQDLYYPFNLGRTALWHRQFNLVRVTLQPGIRDVVREARDRGIHLGVVTLSGREFATEVIQAFNLMTEQDWWVGVFSEHTHPSLKPHPEAWRKALRLANNELRKRNQLSGGEIRPSDVLVLENSVKGAFSALLAGMEVVVRDGEKDRDDLQEEYFNLSAGLVLRYPQMAERLKRLMENHYNSVKQYRTNPGHRTSSQIEFLEDWHDLV